MYELEQMRLKVYEKNGKLYLEGWALNALGGSAYILGNKDQYYEVSEQQLND